MYGLPQRREKARMSRKYTVRLTTKLATQTAADRAAKLPACVRRDIPPALRLMSSLRQRRRPTDERSAGRALPSLPWRRLIVCRDRYH